MLSTVLATLFSISLASTPLPQPIFVEIDCDAGQNLARALQRPELTPGSTVSVRGTCTGRFVVSTDRLRLQGAPAGGTVLKAPASDPFATVVEVRDATGVSLRWLEIRDGERGVYFHRSPDGLLGFSRLHALVVGAEFEESQDSRVLECHFSDNQVGLNAWQRSTVNVQRSTFSGSGRTGLAASDYTTLLLNDSTVYDSGQAGIEVRDFSSARLAGTIFESSGDLHVFASGHSSIHVSPGTMLGGAFDSTRFSAGIDDNSSLRAAVPSTFVGDLIATGNSTIELSGIDVHGAILTQSFSKVVLFGTRVMEPAECSIGGDLVCFGGATAETSGCASATGTCLAPGSAAPEPSEESSRPTNHDAIDRLLRTGGAR